MSKIIDSNSLKRIIAEQLDRDLPQCRSSEVIINSQRVLVEIADTDYLRNRGLMFRENLEPNGGMLFMFPNESKRSFWMKNTSIPLSIAFIDGSGVITNIEDMRPHCLESVCSSRPAPYALEMNLGWFEGNAMPGDKVLNIPKVFVKT